MGISERHGRLRVLKRLLRKLLKSDLLDYVLEDSRDDELLQTALTAPSSDLALVGDVLMVYLHIRANRYLSPRVYQPRAPVIMEFLENMNASSFRQDVRMTREFEQILRLIECHEVFSNQAHPQQAPPRKQLMVTLKRLGCHGNGASVGMLARFFRCSVGSVEVYTARCLMALLSLEREVVTWPDQQEQGRIARRIRMETGFPGCVGFSLAGRTTTVERGAMGWQDWSCATTESVFVDGRLFVFENKPELGGTDYYSRKGCYGMAGLVVCDDRKRVRYLYSGWAGCAHDARLMTNSDLTTQRTSLYDGQQYLLADSGFTLETTVVPCFKKPPHSQLSRDQHRFNHQLSKLRVGNEHCIGLVKGRFQSLRGLRLRLRHEADGQRIVAWIRACVVLHNLLLPDDDVDESGDDPNAWVPVEGEMPGLAYGADVGMPSEERGNTAGKRKRKQVMSAVSAFMDEDEATSE